MAWPEIFIRSTIRCSPKDLRPNNPANARKSVREIIRYDMGTKLTFNVHVTGFRRSFSPAFAGESELLSE
jgi:hypothetical protein